MVNLKTARLLSWGQRRWVMGGEEGDGGEHSVPLGPRHWGGFLALAGAALGRCWGHRASVHTRQRELSRMLSQTRPNPSCAPQRLQQPQGTKPRRPLEQGIALGVKFNTPPSPDKAVLPAPGALALPALARGVRGLSRARAAAGGQQGWCSCRGAQEPAQEAKHLSRCPRDSWSSQNLLSIPRGNQTVRGSLKIAAQGTNWPERRGSEKGDGLQLSKEQSPAQPGPRSAPRKQGPLHPSEGQQLRPFTHHPLSRDVPRCPTAKSPAAVLPWVTLSTAGC